VMVALANLRMRGFQVHEQAVIVRLPTNLAHGTDALAAIGITTMTARTGTEQTAEIETATATRTAEADTAILTEGTVTEASEGTSAVRRTTGGNLRVGSMGNVAVMTVEIAAQILVAGRTMTDRVTVRSDVIAAVAVAGADNPEVPLLLRGIHVQQTGRIDAVTEQSVPARPSGHVLDQGHHLLTEATASAHETGALAPSATRLDRATRVATA
jgi:hypothetical protein